VFKETWSKVLTGKHSFNAFSIQNGLKRDALSSLLFIFALEDAIRKSRMKKEGLELFGTHQLLVYAGVITTQSENIVSVKGNTEALLEAEEVGLELHAEKMKCKFMSRYQNAGRNHAVKIANKSFENVAKFKYFRNDINKNCIHKGIKSKLNFLNASL
jgi:hypothetical protein